MGPSCSFAEVVILYCQHTVRADADVTAACANADGLRVRASRLPCSSKVQAPDILELLESGADAVEVVACPSDGCRLLVGCGRAEKRVVYVQRLLEEIGMGAARVGLSRARGLSAEELIGLGAARAGAAAEFGPNPMKAGEKR